ncbi:hypothetical protein [Helicobacter ailurogastricus]|uniref:hypothetical protein n=1 Tax=Helicobacter ailurogastricus TaxID=1578720 RepID=UPI00244D9530|nr:hypothetical protein [Helicobacter ailurogastricus]GMB91725.1 hypothetical protein NHP190009_08960 [Helicobacter ailurogastricus]
MVWFLWLLSVACLQALTIQTIQDLSLKQKSGHFSGAVFYKNTAQKQLIVEGVYRLEGNKLFLQALRLKKLQAIQGRTTPQPKPAVRVLTLTQLKATQELGALLPSKINKGTRIYFKDPSPKKMAQMLGLPYQDYVRFSPQEKTIFLNPTAPQSAYLQSRDEREETQNPKERESKINLEKRTYAPKTTTAKSRTRSSTTRTRSARSATSSTRSPSSRAKTTRERSANPTSRASSTATNATRARSVRSSSTSSKRTTRSNTRSTRTTRSPSTRTRSASPRTTRRGTGTQDYSPQSQNFNPHDNQNQSPNTQAQHYNPPSQSSGTSAPHYNPSPTYNPSYMPLPLNYPQTSTPSQTPSMPTNNTPQNQSTQKAAPTPTPSDLIESPKETPKSTESKEKQPEPTEQPQDKKAKQPEQEKPELEAKKLEPNPKATLEVQTHLGMGGPQEVACGFWTYDDEKLQAKRPSVVRALDKTSGQYLDISPCDFKADSASAKGAGITLAYTELPPKIEVLGPTTTMHTFILSKANYSERLCYKAKTRQCLHIEPNTTTEWTSTYSTTTTKTTKTYQRPPQVGQTTPTEYSTTTEDTKAERKTDIKKNDLHLSPQFMEFVEVYEKKYLDSQVAHSKEYLEWREKHVRPKQGTCSEYEIEELIKNKKVRPSIHNTRIVCVKSGDYLLEENSTQASP